MRIVVFAGILLSFSFLQGVFSSQELIEKKINSTLPLNVLSKISLNDKRTGVFGTAQVEGKVCRIKLHKVVPVSKLKSLFSLFIENRNCEKVMVSVVKKELSGRQKLNFTASLAQAGYRIVANNKYMLTAIYPSPEKRRPY